MKEDKNMKENKNMKEDKEIKGYAEKLFKLNEKKKVLKRELEKIESDRKILIEMLVEIYRLKRITSVTFEELGNVYLHVSSFPKINDLSTLEKWLIENKMFEAMLSFNKNKLGAFCRECVENNKSLPEGVELFLKEDIRIKKH